MRSIILCVAFLATALAIAGCSSLEKVRGVADAAVAVQHQLDLEALRQVELERRRLRSARCHSPLLTPASLSAAAEDPELGEPWVEELLRDCPQFSTFLSNLVVSRARGAGVPLH
jgi:hypothetical protein